MSHPKIDIRVRELEAKGHSVLEKTETTATLVKDAKVKHWLHILLSVLSTGLWIPVYLWRLGSVNSKVHLEMEGLDALRERKSGNKSKLFATFGILPILGLTFFGSGLTSTPNGTSSSSFTSSTQELDKSCRAMKTADLILATIGKQHYEGRAVSPAQLDSLKSAEEGINNSYQATDGEFYSYMVGQANNLYLVRINMAAKDFTVAEMAIDAYLDNDRYSQFCN